MPSNSGPKHAAADRIHTGFRWREPLIYAAVCAIVIWIYAGSAQSGHLELASARPRDSYYNLLVQGFQAGQLNVKRDAPAGLVALANPYDPAANSAYVWDARNPSYEMSYYKGKFYLYFGVTPALVLFWPYAAVTGHYLLHRDAVVVFFSIGFLAAAGLLYAAWRRYFSSVSIWAVAAALLGFGLASGALEPLSHCDVYEVAHSCGFTFVLLTLGALWCALHEPRRQVLWVALASLAYGLALGARPSLLFGAVVLLLPAAHAWRSSRQPRDIRRIFYLLVAAVVPITLAGTGLLIYNYLRFDSPFEFGWHYQLTDVQNRVAQQFSVDYLAYNLKLYFLEPIAWGHHFPYLKMNAMAVTPSHYYGLGEPFCGILVNYPLAWLALAVPLAWRTPAAGTASSLRWFAWIALLVFATCGLTLCLFFSGSSGYLPDFLPSLMLLAALGVLALEQRLTAAKTRRWVARTIWSALLAYSILFNVLASVKTHAAGDYFDGNSLFNQGRLDEAIEYYEKAAALEPTSAAIYIGLGNVYARKGSLPDAIASYQKALEIDPANVEAQYDLGLAYLYGDRIDEGAALVQKALAKDPAFAETQNPATGNNFAWSLATSPDPEKRNGTVAVLLAEAACRKT
ncbi:MAG TPA: tetratricopeptide repeat protein, partial [Verrucomicrobiae bacterium]|nr:tetratricopeptide repeat protein [Verrucomicrobiae bacterium]